MRFSRKLKAAICQVLIGMLLFTQSAFAARPCVEAGMSAASALTADKNGGCCETSVTEVNLCVMQCTDSDKVSAHTPLIVPPAATQVVLTVAVQDSTHAQWGWPWLNNTAARDPPKTVRFCSFLI